MGTIRFLWDKISDAAIYTNGGWAPTLPLANILTDDVQQVARSRSANPADTQFRGDLGGPTPVNAFWLRAGFSKTARVRFAVSNTPSGGPYLADSGWMQAVELISTFGVDPWGVFEWGGAYDPAAYPAGPEIYWQMPGDDPVVGQYLWCWIDDQQHPLGFVDIGRFMAGAAWSPPHNMNYGASIDTIPLRQPKRTQGGLKLKPKGPQYRELALTFEHIPVGVANTVFAGVNHRLSNSGTFLAVYDPDGDPAYRYRRTIFGSLKTPGRIVETSFGRCSWAITIEEEI